MKNAVLVTSAQCHGSGCDRFKTISGLTKEVIAQIPDGMAVLVYSHTQYKGQKYKLAVNQGKYGWTHRQIIDCDYIITSTI